MAAEGGIQRLGTRHAGLGRQEVGDLAGEYGERAVEKFGIEILERGVEEGAGFGEEAGEFLLGEGRVAVPGVQRARGRGGTAAEAHAGEPAGPGWLGARGRARGAGAVRGMHSAGRGARGSVSVHGVADCGVRRGRAPRSAGLSETAGDSVAHGSTEPVEEARANPWVGLGRTVGGFESRCHGGGVWRVTNGMSMEITTCWQIFCG